MRTVTPYGRATLLTMDAREALFDLDDNSVDSVVTDPPYALESVRKRFGAANAAPAKHGRDGLYARQSRGFMGQTWDTGEVAFDPEFWREVLRVLKPGGHVLAFGGTRTYHHLAMAIEEAGFEIRDQLGWMYGSGFPKSHNLGDGWGSALKPAWEPIAFGRKPCEGSLSANFAKWGLGGLNIDGCRVGGDDNPVTWAAPRGGIWKTDESAKAELLVSDKGRWPANLAHDGSDEVLAIFPQSKSGGAPAVGTPRTKRNTYGEPTVSTTTPRGPTEGSAARFFYCAKASKSDRDEGLDDLPEVRTGGMQATADGSMLTGSGNERTTTRANFHPTVKPTPLMEYYCRLVTPPGGVVLDPFLGSGSTGKAAMLQGFRFIGVELSAEYMEIARRRIEHAEAANLPEPVLDTDGY